MNKIFRQNFFILSGLLVLLPFLVNGCMMMGMHPMAMNIHANPDRDYTVQTETLYFDGFEIKLKYPPLLKDTKQIFEVSIHEQSNNKIINNAQILLSMASQTGWRWGPETATWDAQEQLYKIEATIPAENSLTIQWNFILENNLSFTHEAIVYPYSKNVEKSNRNFWLTPGAAIAGVGMMSFMLVMMLWYH